jgi:hypothetical protein
MPGFTIEDKAVIDKVKMKRKTPNFNFAILIISYFIISLLKSDKDIFVFQEFVCHPQLSYTELPFDREKLILDTPLPVYPKIFKTYNTKARQDFTIIHNESFSPLNILQSTYLHSDREIFILPAMRIISVLFRQNIAHKSSDNDELNRPLFS